MTRYPALVVLLALAPSDGSAQSREIVLWTSRAIATVLAEIGPTFEQSSGYRLNITSDLASNFTPRLNAGGYFDLVITGSATVDQWLQAGALAPHTRTDIARSGIGVAVRKGARKPDVSTIESFRQALLTAKSIAYLPVGSGLHVAMVVERLGIADSIKSKVTRPDEDVVSELVANGEVELGIVVITQILTSPGVELAGPLPGELQSSVTFTAAVNRRSTNVDAALELIRFLRSPAAIAIIRKQGMEPRAP